MPGFYSTRREFATLPLFCVLSVAFLQALVPVGLCQTAPAWLNDEVKRVTPQVIADYKQIHEHPELGKEEVNTAALVRSEMERLGFSVFVPEPTLKTAVIAVLDSGKPGAVVVLRSELDARPGTERVEVDYKSQDPEKMHSCGHDAHTAILLATADILVRHKAELKGKYVFLFQPAEETPGGADDIVNDKILEQLHANMIFAQHVTPGLPVGTMQVTPGPIMASSIYFTIRVHGSGSHAASPELGSDVIRVAAEVADGLSNFPARHFNVLDEPVVISITHFEAGQKNALNKIPEDAAFEGTIRSFVPTGSTEAKKLFMRLEEYLSGMAAANHVSITPDWRSGSPVSINDPELYERLVPRLSKAWSGKLLTEGEKSMYSEDFAYYTKSFPSLYFSLGISDGLRGTHDVHTDEFDISLEALPAGVRFLVTLAMFAQ
jgi:amidohydrolase